LNQSFTRVDFACAESSGALRDELILILKTRNGFNAFESALHLFPAQTSLLSVGIDEWNRPDGWRKEYGDLSKGCLFFAEDIFGGQFCIESNCVWQFDPETGERVLLGASLDEWAKKLLSDYEVLTGYPLAHAWQEVNGIIPEGMRLVPRTPFVLNGEFALSNLVLMESEKSMRVRGNLARQIKNLPDGAQISFRIDP
jgi:hypothetical protein